MTTRETKDSVVDGDSRDARLGRILDDFLSRRSRGTPMSEAALLARHADLADDLREMLDAIRDLRPREEHIDALIRRGTLRRSTDPRFLATLGSYGITSTIGRGGMGIVLAAYDADLDRTVALKILRPALADDEAVRARFEREARVAAGLRHPNVVTIHAVGRRDATPFIAMEYVAGPSLAEIIRTRGPLSGDATRRILRELLMGLSAIHARGLIHRDIKSSNVLLDGWLDGRTAASGADPGIVPGGGTAGGVASALPSTPFVKIVDFGLARARSARTTLTLKGSVLGTPGAMSPEQARGDATIDHRTDLYSAGVVLYEMLTGVVPFKAESAAAVIYKILHEAPRDPRALKADADAGLSALALRLMSKRPQDRCASADEARAFLEPGAPLCPSPRWRGVCRRVRIALIVALIVAPIVAAGAWLGLRSMHRDPQGIEVRVDPETRRSIQVRAGSDPTFRTIRMFPPDALWWPGGATEVLLDGRDEWAVAAALREPVEGFNVFLYDTAGARLRAWDISNHPNVESWPDCGPPALWTCTVLARGDLDGKPGDELLVVARDESSYPARITIIQPDSREPGPTFWHTGHIEGAFIEPDFLGPGRPAIIAWGYNNKGDGFGLPFPPRPYHPPPGEDRPRTDYDLVTVVMVLDPAEMDGLGPPRNRRIDIPPARAHAYALLDAPPSVNAGTYVPMNGTKRVRPDPSRVSSIFAVSAVPQTATKDHDRRLKVSIARAGLGSILTCDARLNIVGVDVTDGTPPTINADYWRARWRVVIQDGEYVDD